jgi:hypothetical protein
MDEMDILSGLSTNNESSQSYTIPVTKTMFKQQQTHIEVELEEERHRTRRLKKRLKKRKRIKRKYEKAKLKLMKKKKLKEKIVRGRWDRTIERTTPKIFDFLITLINIIAASKEKN